MAKSPTNFSGMIEQIASEAQQQGVFQRLQDGALGKKKAPKNLEATPPPALEAPTWTPPNLSPEQRTDLLRVMMQRSGGAGPPAASGQIRKGAQQLPGGGA